MKGGEKDHTVGFSFHSGLWVLTGKLAPLCSSVWTLWKMWSRRELVLGMRRESRESITRFCSLCVCVCLCVHTAVHHVPGFSRPQLSLYSRQQESGTRVVLYTSNQSVWLVTPQQWNYKRNRAKADVTSHPKKEQFQWLIHVKKSAWWGTSRFVQCNSISNKTSVNSHPWFISSSFSSPGDYNHDLKSDAPNAPEKYPILCK